MRIHSLLIAIGAAAALAACGDNHGAPDAPSAEDCGAAGDEDGNGAADCDDPACAGAPSCQPACGNGTREAGEDCDDGNAVDGDSCDSNCTPTGCGNGVMTAGELCDDGNAVDGDSCDSNCTPSGCGNGIMNAGEVCDDGNTASWDGCASTCAGEVFAYIKASNTASFENFSTSMALSADGSTLAVGATGEDSAAIGIDGNQADNSAENAGAVYVFRRSGATWVQQAYLKASNTGAGDVFGASVALSADGSTLAVGARDEDSAATDIGGDQADNSAASAGAVYVFTRSGGVWGQQAYVKASNTGAGDAFGIAVSLSADGSTLAVGARDEDSAAIGIGGDQADNAASNAGAVYVFSRTGTTWSQQAYIKASNAAASDQFGTGVTLSSDASTLAVGATGEDSAATGIDGNQADNSVSNAGAVYVFTRSGTAWTQQAYVKQSNTGASSSFGGFEAISLSNDGSVMAVGASTERSAATGIDGDQTDTSIPGAGAVYVFERTGTTWSQRTYVKSSNTGLGDIFGRAVALSDDGSTLAVGAPNEDSATTGFNGDQADNSTTDSGAVYVFERTGTTWVQRGYIKAPNTGSLDFFGSKVKLSATGALAVGAVGEASMATGVGGNQANNSFLAAGAVYVLH